MPGQDLVSISAVEAVKVKPTVLPGNSFVKKALCQPEEKAKHEGFRIFSNICFSLSTPQIHSKYRLSGPGGFWGWTLDAASTSARTKSSTNSDAVLKSGLKQDVFSADCNFLPYPIGHELQLALSTLSRRKKPTGLPAGGQINNWKMWTPILAELCSSKTLVTPARIKKTSRVLRSLEPT